MFKLLIFLALCLAVVGCKTYPYKPKISYLLFEEHTQEQNDTSKYLFWNNEPLSFSYKKIGRIEVAGDFKDDVLLDFLKWKAHEVHANGIITIEKTKSQILSKHATANYPAEYQTITVLSGIAVDIQTDSAFIAKYGMAKNDGYYQRVMAYSIPEEVKPGKVLLLGAATLAITSFGIWKYNYGQ